MVYLVTIQTQMKDVVQYKVITKGFACTNQEFVQEVASYLGVDKIQIKDIETYQDEETANIIIKSRL